jgi:ankyrin repeat protein
VQRGEAALARAASRGHAEIVKVLLQRGANVNARSTVRAAPAPAARRGLC